MSTIPADVQQFLRHLGGAPHAERSMPRRRSGSSPAALARAKIGRCIRAARAARGVSPFGLAALAGITTVALEDIERGRSWEGLAQPRRIVLRLARLLEIPEVHIRGLMPC